MGRHSKNNNDRPFFTYHERQAARKGYASSAFYKHANCTYGGGEIKVGSDSLRDFDACCLSLHPCRDPVITPQGYLFEREVIYEYVLQKRKDNERALQAWSAQEASDAAGAEEAQREAEERALQAFESGERGLVGAAGPSAVGRSSRALTTTTATGATSSVRGHVVNDDVRKHAADLNFWTPQNAPVAAKRAEKPDTTIRCPMSGEPLRLKQLVTVKFAPADGSDDASKLESTKPNERYVDPVSHKALANGSELFVLRPSGTVVTRATIDKAIKQDMLDPFSEPPAKLKDKDIIQIKTEGTGFAQRGQIEVKKKGAMRLTFAG